MPSRATRTEHDLLGDKAVPADAYYGVQTARALENFHISGVELRLYPNLIRAFAMVKLGAARANFECGQFGKEILAGIEKACQEIIDGKLHDQFVLDVFQGGAGTSTNDVGEAGLSRPRWRRVLTEGQRRGGGYDGVNGNEVDDDKLGLIASDDLNPQKARVLLRLALLKPRPAAELQRIFMEY